MFIIHWKFEGISVQAGITDVLTDRLNIINTWQCFLNNEYNVSQTLLNHFKFILSFKNPTSLLHLKASTEIPFTCMHVTLYKEFGLVFKHTAMIKTNWDFQAFSK